VRYRLNMQIHSMRNFDFCKTEVISGRNLRSVMYCTFNIKHFKAILLYLYAAVVE